MNKNNIKNINPIIFIKKVNDKHKIIPLKKTTLVLGANRHFPPAVREWYNSIYAYNKNTMNNLSIIDKLLNSFIESYFNLYFNNKTLKSDPLSIRDKRLSFEKIFISKPDLKHTSSKVIITLHIYNEEQRYLNSKLKYLLNTLYPKKKNFFFKGIKKHTNLSLAYNKSKFSFIKENLSLKSYLDNLYSSICRRTDIEEYLFNPITLENFEEYKKLHEDIKFFLSIKTLEDYRNLKKAYEYILFYSFYEKNIQELSYYKLLLNLNKLLYNLFTKISSIKINNKLSLNTSKKKNNFNKEIEKTILNTLKYKNIYGARLEAKGRLTKRFTASRSLFKLK